MFKFTFIFCLVFFLLPIYGNLVTNHTVEVKQYKSVPVYGIDSSEYLKSLDTVKSAHLSEKNIQDTKWALIFRIAFIFLGLQFFYLFFFEYWQCLLKILKMKEKRNLNGNQLN